MSQSKPSLWQIFTATFTLSAFTFGGGYVIVTLMKERFVDRFQWIEEDEMLDLVALSQSAPGAMAINASIIVGYKLRGLLGALTATIGTVLPPFLIITIISALCSQFCDFQAPRRDASRRRRSDLLRGLRHGSRNYQKRFNVQHLNNGHRLYCNLSL